jgi:hypothetical protein
MTLLGSDMPPPAVRVAAIDEFSGLRQGTRDYVLTERKRGVHLGGADGHAIERRLNRCALLPRDGSGPGRSWFCPRLAATGRWA